MFTVHFANQSRRNRGYHISGLDNSSPFTISQYDLYIDYHIILRLGITLLNMFNDMITLQWRHNGLNSISNHQPHDCLLNRLFRHRSKKTSKLRVIGLCVGNSPGTGELPAQMASNAENVSIWWRHDESIEINVLGFMDESLFLSLYTTDWVHLSLSIPQVLWSDDAMVVGKLNQESRSTWQNVHVTNTPLFTPLWCWQIWPRPHPLIPWP